MRIKLAPYCWVWTGTRPFFQSENFGNSEAGKVGPNPISPNDSVFVPQEENA